MSISENELKELIASICRISVESIHSETRFVADLHMDSLASLDLLTELEERHEIVISQDEARHLQTFGKLVEHLKTREG